MRLLAAALLLVALLPLHAAPIEAELGESLRYHRAHALPAELPQPAPRSGTLVLDLRYATADAAAATALDGWIKFRASAETPLLVLVNADTAPVLHGVFAANQAQPGFVTIGIAQSAFIPDIVVTITPEADRRAYDALENKVPITALLAENTDKLRNDEATMMRERTHPGESFADEAFAEPSSPTSGQAPAAATAPPPSDAILQRAVHLQRALRALKRIP